jgi:hypothetical protein
MLKRIVITWFLFGLIFGMNCHIVSSVEKKDAFLLMDNSLPDEGLKYSLDKVGQYHDRYGAPTNIVVQRALAFVASRWGGLLIFNVSNPQQPILIGTFNEERMITKSEPWANFLTNGIDVIDNLVLLADGNNGLLLINASDPAEPRLMGKYPCEISYLKANENYAYIICKGTAQINYGNVFQIIDISDAENPILVGEINQTQSGGFFHEPYISENVVYATSGHDLVTIDITNPYQPIEIASLNISGGNYITKVDNYLLVSKFTELKILNVSNPVNPILITTFQTNADSICSITAINTTAFVADLDSQYIYTINITDIVNPSQIGLISYYSNGGLGNKDITLDYESQDFLYCADFRLGLFCFDVTNKSQPELIGAFDTNCLAWALDVEGEYAYICSRRENPYYPSRLEIIDITNNSKPALVGKYDCLDDTIRDVKVSGGYAYLCLAGEGLRILDVHDPTNPVVVGNYSNNFTVGFFYNIWYDAESQLCYLPHPYYDLLIIDCSDPSQPTLLSTFETWQSFLLNNVFLENNVAYLTSFASPGEIAIVDISNPQQPVLLSQKKVGDVINDIYVKEGRAYLTGLYDPLIILDVSDPTTPELLSMFDNRWFYGQGVAVEGSFAYIAQYVGGLRVVDVSNPKKPFEVAAIRDHYRGICWDVYVREGYIFIADGWDGLEIYQLVPPKISQRLILILSILPSIVGTGIVTFIAIMTIKRRKSSPTSD